MPEATASRPHVFSTRFKWAAFLLGLGFGGFFDGILLHQILQWHHLLSAIEQGALADLRAQILADGLFHALMYLIAAVGLVKLVRARGELAMNGAAAVLLAGFLVGFGTWHIVDAVLSHWLTGIHRVRMDADNPLFWDLLWLVVFGLVPLAAAWVLRQRSGTPGGPGAVAACLLVAVTCTAGVLGARPVDPDAATVTVVLRPGASPARLFAALASSDARIVWSDRVGGVWVLQSRGDRLELFDLYRHGAMFVSGTMAPAGCSAWVAGPVARQSRI
jgi:uncharacterized membrane protein